MRNETIETLFQSQGLEFEYLPSVPTSSIDRAKSKANQVRLDTIHRDAINGLRLSIQEGMGLPALVAYEDKPGVRVVIDGRHRLAAYDAEGIEETDMYLLKTTDPSERVGITVTFNQINGIKPDTEELSMQAVHLLAHGFTARQTAEKIRMTTSFVQDSRTDSLGRDRATRLNLANRWDKITARQSRVLIQRGVRLDVVFEAAVRFVAAFDAPIKTVKPLVDKIAKAATEAEQIELVHEATRQAKIDRTRTRRKGNPNGQPRSTLFKAQLTGVIGTTSAAFNGMDAAQRKDMLNVVSQGIRHLTEIEQSLLVESSV